MRVRDFIVVGLMLAVLFVLGRIIFGSPLVTRVRESFASGSGSGSGSGPPRTVNTMTECPTGSQMYMYNGAAFCCSGSVDPNADRLADTCKATASRRSLTFCTLGPSKGDVKNCLELRSGLMEAEGESVCTTKLPTFVKGAEGSATQQGRCCGGPGNAALTECKDQGADFCDVSTETNVFKAPGSCQFQRAQEDVGACPTKFGPFTGKGQGSLADLTLFGCTDNGQNCYADSTLKRLKELGYDVSSLVSCTTFAKQQGS
jgi:hypothetical protein